MARNVQMLGLVRRSCSCCASPKENPMYQDGPTLGDLVSALYEELIEEFGDPELAKVMAATMVNEMILSGNQPDKVIAAA